MSNFLDFLTEILLPVFLVLLVTIAFSVALVHLVAPLECEAATVNIELESRWSFWGGCQIEIESGRWIPLENWYYVEQLAQ